MATHDPSSDAGGPRAASGSGRDRRRGLPDLPDPLARRAELAHRHVCAIFDECRDRGGPEDLRDAALISVVFGANVPLRSALRLRPSAWDPETGMLVAPRAPAPGGSRLDGGSPTPDLTGVTPRPVGPRRHAVDGARSILRRWSELRGDAPGRWLGEIGDIPDRRRHGWGSMTPADAVSRLERHAARAGVRDYSLADFVWLYRSPWWEEA